MTPSVIDAARHPFAPPSQKRIWEWARENVWLPASYSIQGEFHIERSNHLRAVFDAIWDKRVRSVAFEKAVKIGGTMVADISQLYMLSNRPGPMMLVMQTGQEAVNHAVTKVLPNVKGCKALRHVLSDNRHDITHQRIMLKSGVPFYINGPATAGLQAKDIRYLFLDECWEMLEDTYKQALARTEAYARVGTDKTVFISQGSEIRVENGIEIPHFFDARMRRATDKWWHVPCPHCLVKFNPRLEFLDEGGNRIAGLMYDGNGLQVRYVCPHCRQVIIDSPRLKAMWNDAGEYVQTNPTPAIGEESFHCGAIPISSWNALALKHADAIQAMRNGSIVRLKAFIQKDMAESWKDKSGAEPIKFTPFGFGEKSKWADEFVRVMTFDIQKDHFWALIRAWAKYGASRLICAGRFETWDDLRELQTTNNVVDGMVFGDEAYGKRTAETRRQCYRFGWSTMRGASSETKSFQRVVGVDKAGKEIKQPSMWRELVGEVFVGDQTHELKDFLKTLSLASQVKYMRGDRTITVIEWIGNPIRDIVRNMIDGKGAEWLAHDGVSHTYRAHLAGQRKETGMNKKTGVVEEFYKVIGDDHLLDCENMQIPVVDALGILKV